ncbi:calcium-activated chloride channel regulator 2-like [Centruroides sculpturatus]|uniref:calcium-activated chloride channel regulator 2-like n=1 Tax=Centruroides sculpturatus TaxID=218467 RepID=UPI000C6D84A6|nr:calcium-activated chloride channel regulator 2-like [Centruroides sculpturatus]XP_023221390.1 calcium-activated chloride channel regulator 2-like [Centruroides sculpturatus]
MWRYVTVFVFCCSFVGIWCKSSIRLENNGYTGILVAISPTIQPVHHHMLIYDLKELLSVASEKLFHLTKRRAYFREVTFLIPSSWDDLVPWIPKGETVSIANEEKYKDATIYVERGGAFGKTPYAIQTGGCKKEGLRIHLPLELLDSYNKRLLKINDDNTQEEARKLVFEWAKYRYGIFNEHGFPGDERYPEFYGIPGDSKPRVTSCLNWDIEIVNNSCLPKVDNSTGKLDKDCPPEVESLVGRRSSFMYSPQLEELCGLNQNHDARAPTKHNTLCKERSIWEVIMQHEDFKDGMNSPPPNIGINTPTNFKIVQLRDAPLRMVVAIDRSKLVTEERGSIMNKAVLRFLQFIPENSLVGSIQFGGSSESCFPKELKSVKENPLVEYQQLTEELPCIKCALLESVNLLEKENTSNGGIIVLLTMSELTNEDLANLTDIIINRKVTVHIIKLYFNNYLRNLKQLQIISKTGGSVQEIPLNTEMSEEERIIQLYLALCRTVHGDIFETYDDKVMIFQDVVKDSPINITFPVDFSIRRDFTLVYSTSNPRRMNERSLRLSTDNAVFVREKFDYFFHDKGRRIVIPEAKAGEYNFILEKFPDYSDPVFVSVFAKHNVETKALTARCWLNTNNQMVNLTSPVILYAEVHVGNQPVRNAKVEAILTHPDSSKTILSLIDDGIGDPDITKDDGIYSRYLVEFSTAGAYSLTLLVDDGGGKAEYFSGSDGECCGSFVPVSSPIPTGAFRRLYDYGNFYVFDVPEDNVYPPNRIADLALTKIETFYHDSNHSNWRIIFYFRFSSAGEDYNVGSASTYEMKYFFHREEVAQFDVNGFSLDDWEYHSKFQKLPYGSHQTLRVELSLEKLRRELKSPLGVYFAARAADEHGNRGEVSNTAEALLEIPEIPTPPPTATTETGDDQGDGNHTKDSLKVAGGGLSALQIGMIVGIIAGALVIIMVLICVVLMRKRKTSRKQRKFEKKDIKRPSIDYLEENNKKNSNSTLNHLSPVQSWPANVLMDHYDRVQEAKQKNVSVPIMKVEDVLESSSVSSGKSLKSNDIYEGGYEAGNEYFRRPPTAPLSSSTGSLADHPRHVTQV